MKIGDREIGLRHPPYFIADIGANHDGDIDRALFLIDRAAEVGVDAVKFQNFSARKIVSRRGFEEMGKVGHQAGWSTSVYDAYQNAAMPLRWISFLAERCAEREVTFLTTPYDLEMVDELDEYVPAWKVGSGDITYYELIRRVASKGKPVILSTGASARDEVWRTLLSALGEEVRRNRLVLLQCNTNYTGDPANFSYLNLSVIPDWIRVYECAVGLSDHTPGHLAVCAAVALGACVIEKHFTDDWTRPGPDHAFAMEPEAWQEMIEAAGMVWEALGDGSKKVEGNEREARIIQRRALRWAQRMPYGAVVLPQDVVPTRPCPEGALEPYRIGEVVGKHLKRDVEADTLVELEDLR